MEINVKERYSESEKILVSIICFILIGIFIISYIDKQVKYANRERVITLDNYEKYVSISNESGFENIATLDAKKHIGNLNIKVEFTLHRLMPNDITTETIIFSAVDISEGESISIKMDTNMQLGWFVKSYTVVSVYGELD